MPQPLLEAKALTKRFPGVTALKEVSFTLLPGEIHALCGENGAGKSTLIKLLSGIHPHGTFEGTLAVEGRPAAFRGIRDAEATGIAAITQELALVDEMSVAENIFLGRAPTKGLRLDWLEMNHRAAALLAEFGASPEAEPAGPSARPSSIDPETPTRALGIGQKQIVEIARALDKKSRVLILDEPTAALTEREVAVLLDHLRRLRSRGIACIYISHKLDEVFSVADRITVLRDGSSIATLPASATNIPEVIRLMVGREIGELFPRTSPVASGPAPSRAPDNALSCRPASSAGARRPQLEVRGLTVSPTRTALPFLKNLSFFLQPGEILGFGGLMGAGRTELLMHLFGAWGHRVAGEVSLAGVPYANPDPRTSMARGVALASEDRRRFGLVLRQPIGFNLSLSSLPRFTRAFGRLDAPAEHEDNQKMFDLLRIKAPDQSSLAGGLSGGNQQKVVLGKVLMTGPSVVLLDEPTRGIDVGAKQEIYAHIDRLSRQGVAILLASSELPELMGLSDRIIMLAGGRIGGEFVRGEFSQDRLLAAAMGREAA
jgi:D-xylose transport system ATP-binding protein